MAQATASRFSISVPGALRSHSALVNCGRNIRGLVQLDIGGRAVRGHVDRTRAIQDVSDGADPDAVMTGFKTSSGKSVMALVVAHHRDRHVRAILFRRHENAFHRALLGRRHFALKRSGGGTRTGRTGDNECSRAQ